MDKLIQFATKASFFDGPFGHGAPWKAAGMGYVIKGSSLIAVDGGTPEDAEEFVALLEKTAGEFPVVDLWILTHPHIDHYGVLRGISENEDLAARVSVRRVVCLFDDTILGGEYLTEDKTDMVKTAKSVLENIIATTGACHITPEENLTLTSGDAGVKFLYVPCAEDEPDGPNPMSLIFRVDLPTRRVIFTGDAACYPLDKTLKNHKDELKCDVLQLPHHGLCDTGHEGFYEAAGAKVVMIPTCVSGEARMTDGSYGESLPSDYAKSLADRVYRAFEGTAEIN